MTLVRSVSWLVVALSCSALLHRDAGAQAANGLPPPGEILADTTFGRIGSWFTLRTPDGEEIQASEFRERVLFVNFWATWCAPCVQELPTIVDLADSMKEVEVEFLLVSIDDDERLVRRFVRKHDLSGRVYLRGWDAGASTFTAGIVPATFIVTKDGTIAYQHHGAADWNTDSIRRFLMTKAGG